MKQGKVVVKIQTKFNSTNSIKGPNKTLLKFGIKWGSKQKSTKKLNSIGIKF